MKKGFTLIELLAVIVILAIIALIATPIILGIINDARKENNERSAELYASAIKNAIASYQLTHPTAPTKFSDLDIQYDGEVECETEELYPDGSFYITGCKVNGTEVDYTYGEQQVTQPTRYYSWNLNGTVGETEAPQNTSIVPPAEKKYYLSYEETDGKVSTVYVCFIKNKTEYCLKGYDTEAFATNTEIIKDAYSSVVDTDACVSNDGEFGCGADGLLVNTHSDGAVFAGDGSTSCLVEPDGYFECYDL